MENLEMDVRRFINGVVRHRLANDPIRLIAFENLSGYLENDPGRTPAQRHELIALTFGDHNQDLTQLVYTFVQDHYDDLLVFPSPRLRFAKLNKVGIMCFCILFKDIFRQHFSTQGPYYTTLSNLVHLYTFDQVPQSQLIAHINNALYHNHLFRNQLQATLSTMTLLFNLVYPAAGGNPPPPPQV